MVGSYVLGRSSLVWDMLINPWVYVILAAILFLEYKFPANPNQKLFSRGMKNDMVWVPVNLIGMAMLPIYFSLLSIPYYAIFGDALIVESTKD